MTKIVIDARLAGLEHAGIGRYVKMLSQHIKLQITPASPSEAGRANYPSLAKRSGAGKLQVKEIRPEIKHYSLMEQVKLPLYLIKEEPDLVHFPHFNVPLIWNRPFIVTIHDLLWHEQIGFSATTLPKWQYAIKYWGYRAVLRHAVIKAEAVIVPSNWVKERLLSQFPELKDKVKVIYEGVVQCFKTLNSGKRERELQQLLEKYGLISRRYLLYVGSLYPHKNVGMILEVLPRLPELKLLVVCARSVFWQRFATEVRKRGLSKQVILAGFIPDEELAVLYQKALALVFPSKSEGFGLPGLEAMAAGCPVLASTAGSLPEIYGAAAAFFEPDDLKGLIRMIKKVRNDQGYRRKLIDKGKERAGEFTWEKCAKETLGVYESCLSL